VLQVCSKRSRHRVAPLCDKVRDAYSLRCAAAGAPVLRATCSASVEATVATELETRRPTIRSCSSRRAIVSTAIPPGPPWPSRCDALAMAVGIRAAKYQSAGRDDGSSNAHLRRLAPLPPRTTGGPQLGVNDPAVRAARSSARKTRSVSPARSTRSRRARPGRPTFRWGKAGHECPGRCGTTAEARRRSAIEIPPALRRSRVLRTTEAGGRGAGRARTRFERCTRRAVMTGSMAGDIELIAQAIRTAVFVARSRPEVGELRCAERATSVAPSVRAP